MSDPVSPSSAAAPDSSKEPGTYTSKEVAPISEGQMRIAKPFLKLMTWLNVTAFKATNGKIGGTFPGGAPVCLVTMTGRKSRREITIPLIYTPDGEDVLLVASQGGMPRHPVWYHNIAANPNVTIQVGSEAREMVARQATDEEKRERWPRLLSVYPAFDEYQRRTDRNIPVFICSPRASA